MKVLATVDGSPAGLRALGRLSTYVSPRDASVTLLTVYTLPFTAEAATEVVQAGQRTLSAQGFSAQSVVLEGVPALTIMRFAEQGDFDLVVVGSHRRVDDEEMPVYCTALRIAAESTVPVLILKPNP
ncbi:MAG TPA: universal stress protein [Stenomitos sp.]